MRYFTLILLMLFCVSTLFSQSRNDLEKKRKQSIKEIEYTNKLIAETSKNKKNSYNKLLLLNKKISSRKTIISSINGEIAYLKNSVEIHQEIIIGLENDLKRLKNEYAKMIYYSYLHNNKYDKLMFILASDNVNTAFRRIKYFQQYSDYRLKQAENIQKTKIEIGDKIVELEIIKAQKTDLLLEEKVENQKLIVEKQEKNSEIKQLSYKEKDLKNKLRKQNDIANKLQAEITRIIEEEARLAAEKLKTNNTGLIQLTPEEKILADVFYRNRNRLPWPTERGVITGKFGRQAHPLLKGIFTVNNGVDISTTEGAPVRAIYDGTVSSVVAIAGANKTVIIRHGNYLSVYSNLKEVIVKQGDKVKTKQTLGIIFTETDKDHKSVLKFQIWKDKEKLNPAEWLTKGSNG